jgi:hypothetical protein
MVITSLGFMPQTAKADDVETEDPAGWYLTDYSLVINTKKTTGSFMQGGSYSDILSIYDIEGTEMQELESDLENDIRLSYGRYSEKGDYLCGYDQTISWDSPEDYYAEGTIIELMNVSNLEISHKSWSCRYISARFNLKTIKDTYDYKFLDSSGNNQFGVGSEEITVKTEKAIPKAVNGDTAYLIVNFGNSTFADSQAIYTYVWKAPIIEIKAKTYNMKVAEKGWYLTGYQFEHDPYTYSESRFFDGSLCIDTKTIYDGNGEQTKSKVLENNLYVYNERYFGEYVEDHFGVGVRYELNWDSPAAFIASGEYFQMNNWSSTVLATSDKWGAPSIHFYAETSKYLSEITDTKGNSFIGATEPIALKSKKAFPEGTAEQKLNAFIVINGVGKATYTYTWKNATLSVPTVTKSKVTLYLSGPDKKLTYKIGLKNATGYTVSYKSRNTSVASVGKTGTITAKKAGTANIVVTFKGGGKTYYKSMSVVVKKK